MFTGYIPPMNYGLVEEDLHRSGMPTEPNFTFLETLNLKTVLCVSKESPDPIFVAFLKDRGVNLISLVESQDATTHWYTIPEEAVLEALRVIFSAEMYPLLVVGGKGTHRVGTVIACLRKKQNWCLSSIYEEYRRFTIGDERKLYEQFIEMFDEDLVNISRTSPAWYTLQQQSSQDAA